MAPNLNTTVNPFSWSEATHLLFVSQPLGVGFSHGLGAAGSVGSGIIGTTQAAAEATWQAVRAVLSKLEEIDPAVKPRTLNLWTER